MQTERHQHGRCVVSVISRGRLRRAIASLSILAMTAAPAFAQALSFMPAFPLNPSLLQYAPQQQDDDTGSDQLPAQLRRQMVPYPTTEPPGTIIIDTGHALWDRRRTPGLHLVRRRDDRPQSGVA